jgi:hypothetical protein
MQYSSSAIWARQILQSVNCWRRRWSVPCQDARNIWHIARDGPFTYKTFYDSFYDSFVYKNMEMIQDTILLNLRACLDVYLRNTSCNFYESVRNYCLIWHVLFAEFKRFSFPL